MPMTFPLLYAPDQHNGLHIQSGQQWDAETTGQAATRVVSMPTIP